MRSRRLAFIAGAVALAAASGLFAHRLTAALPQTRTISLYNIHTKDTVTVEYKKDGKYVPAAMDRINWALRDWRKDEKTQMDPALVDLLWEVHTELGSKEPIHIISGYRSRGTNDMLRSTVGGQASQSRHILGKAADVHFPDVPVRRIRYSALIREKGGVGYYPTSAIPFVHLDTDRVRAWPRLPRQELALLFPDGRTQHVPADGQPLSSSDVQAARSQNRELASQIAEVHALHRAVMSPTPFAVASAAGRASSSPPQRVALAAPTAEPPRAPQRRVAETPPPPAPRLVSEPKLVDRPSRLASRTSDDDRMKLAQLAALASMPQGQPATIVPASFDDRAPQRDMPSLTGRASAKAEQKLAALSTDIPAAKDRASQNGRFGWANLNDSAPKAAAEETTWAVAPAFDEEHPEELSYRPFPITPYMTETSSPDDPALARMEHPDVAKTLELLDQAGELPPMRLRPGQQVARVMWAQEFQGEAVSLAKVFGDPPAASGLAERAVRLSAR